MLPFSVPIGSTMPISPERRHEPLGSYRAPPDRPYSVAGQATYHISPERRYDPSYHSSPERRSQQESGYLSSPERRVDHQRSFSGYSTSSSYEESLYGGSIYGTRSGSVTPVIDEEASIHRLRMEYMERQLASLTGLVQKALTSGPPNKNQTPQQQQQQQLQQIPTKDNNQGKDGATINKEDRLPPGMKPSLLPKTTSQSAVIYDSREHVIPKGSTAIFFF
ncbi:coiled-coil domain-containing protein CG32809 [Trichonephila clavipes]|nr:coiled-coil domain-containing protein CG32809 [Trichonephila clavipes]